MEQEQEFSAPCQCCGEDVPESEAHGEPDTDYLCPTCSKEEEQKRAGHYQLTGMAGHTMEITQHPGGYCRLGLCRAACGTYVYAMEPQSEDERADLPVHLRRIIPVESIGLGRLTDEWSDFMADVLAWVSSRGAGS